MKIKLTLGLFILFTLIAAHSHACQFDTDCEVGSKCLKNSYSLYGSCVGGLSPGNQYDQRPTRYPMDMTGKRGETCQFDVQCGVGGRCVKSGYSIYGTCM